MTNKTDEKSNRRKAFPRLHYTNIGALLSERAELSAEWVKRRRRKWPSRWRHERVEAASSWREKKQQFNGSAFNILLAQIFLCFADRERSRDSREKTSNIYYSFILLNMDRLPDNRCFFASSFICEEIFNAGGNLSLIFYLLTFKSNYKFLLRHAVYLLAGSREPPKFKNFSARISGRNYRPSPFLA